MNELMIWSMVGGFCMLLSAFSFHLVVDAVKEIVKLFQERK